MDLCRWLVSAVLNDRSLESFSVIAGGGQTSCGRLANKRLRPIDRLVASEYTVIQWRSYRHFLKVRTYDFWRPKSKINKKLS